MGRRRVVESDSDTEMAEGSKKAAVHSKPLPASKLPKGVQFRDNSDVTAICWNEASNISEDADIFARGHQIQSNKLPVTAERPTGRTVVAEASQVRPTDRHLP